MNTTIFYSIQDTKGNFYIEKTEYIKWVNTMKKLLPDPIKISEIDGDIFVFDDKDTKYPCTTIVEAEVKAFYLYAAIAEKIHSQKGLGYTYYSSIHDLQTSVTNFYDHTVFVYARVFNPMTKYNEKVSIPFDAALYFSNPENYISRIYNDGKNCLEKKQRVINKALDSFMARQQEKYQNNLLALRKQQEESNLLYGDNKTSEKDAYNAWKKIDFRQPAPAQIQEYKRESKLSWVQFMEYVYKVLREDCE